MKTLALLLMYIFAWRGAYDFATDIWDAIANRVLKDKEHKK